MERVNNSGTYQCFHCLHNSVVWENDFDFEDYGYEMEDDNGNTTTEGIVHICRCANCGAEIEYKVPIFNLPSDEELKNSD